MVIILDQLTKAVVDVFNCHFAVIDGLLNISITHNSGAAWGMFSDYSAASIIFAVITIVALAAIVLFVIFRKNESRWLDISLGFIAGGALGNFIDRIALGSVRDFIDLTFFANFNVADIAITVGGIMFVIYFFFLDKDAVFKTKKSDGTNAVGAEKSPKDSSEGSKDVR